ncbi:uncharacterized protein LOC131883686 isoform X2 [Tigriopus californicus]|uniref:uncharacterized protein LOC131883686 isoform X2 n=1 Tax=Tigriopus californicus TaxID=6832 RepID=UPI0027DA58D6|nr:uncharacterized protein LOC131883686 isoform X2 [Tigriopus californicus]
MNWNVHQVVGLSLSPNQPLSSVLSDRARVMDTWDLRLFHLSNLVGLTPFEVDRDRSYLRKVRWKSRQAIYFLIVATWCQVFLLFYSGSLILLITRKGVAFSLRASPWIGATGRQSLANTKWKKDKRRYFIGAFLAFGLIPFVLVSCHICLFTGEIYIHSHLEFYYPEYNQTWRGISNVIHCYSALVCVMGAFFCDILLIFLSIGYFRHFEEINKILISLGVPEEKVLQKRNGISLTISDEIDPMTRRTTLAMPLNIISCHRLQNLLRKHLELQQSLDGFNNTFDDILLAFPVQIFVMVVALFFSIIRDEITNLLELLALLNIGTQFLFRSFIGLYNFGKVQDVGVEAKYILLRDLRIQYQQHFLRPDAAFEVEAFCGVADEVAVKAGSYVSFSKRFLISYYGVLVSYMAIVVQSF